MKLAADATRRREIGAIHAMAAKLGMDTADPSPQSDYRSMLRAIGGGSSSSELSDAGRRKVVAHLRTMVPAPTGRAPRKPRHVWLVEKLWQRLGELGALREPGPAALGRFLQQHASVSAASFLTGAAAGPVIQALKAMEQRALRAAAKQEGRQGHGQPA